MIVKDNPAIAKAAANVGQPGRLKCIASAVPAPKFTWIHERDNVELTTTSSVHITTREIPPSDYEV